MSYGKVAGYMEFLLVNLGLGLLGLRVQEGCGSP